MKHSRHDAPLSFELTEEQSAALRALGGRREIRISGYVDGDQVKVDNISIGDGIVGMSSTPFAGGVAPFIACNGPIEQPTETETVETRPTEPFVVPTEPDPFPSVS